ncbi:MAG TPA: hypothetical protein VG406_13525 [Isosphaeraceae bacterium]|jgi:hypothetical protein|nr:hypothetical protein [Isosphaeraceae bacterium]
MKLDSARDLKARMHDSVVRPLATSVVTKSALGVAAQPLSITGEVPPTVALGITRKTQGDYSLAVRVQKRGLENSPAIDTIRKQAKGEVDIRYIGRVAKYAAPAKRGRPLKIGQSIGHFRITAGTLGAFVRDLAGGGVMILSNNHVLANENKARHGDAILQPGPYDDGKDPADRVATLARFVRLKKTGPNLVDAAVAALDPGMEYDARTLTGLGGKLAGAGSSFLDDQTPVGKIGRTTATTRGKVVTFELDNLLVAYDVGALQFNDQIEIEGDGDSPFSQGGDSGSLIVDADRLAVALLFAGSDLGGTNGKGLTYANPLAAVLSALKVELLSS